MAAFLDKRGLKLFRGTSARRRSVHMARLAGLLLALCLGGAQAWVPPVPRSHCLAGRRAGAALTVVEARSESEEQMMNSEETFGGFTAKQRLREEVESPFRKVRIFFFGASTASALLALYFSLINAGKAYVGGWPEAPPLDDALSSVGINLVAVFACAAITYRDYQAGQASLKRIRQGGALAALVVSPASTTAERIPLKDFRRGNRVLLAAGGAEYISTLARSLNADQREDENVLPALLDQVDVVVVPVLLTDDQQVVGDTRSAWRGTEAREDDRNFDIERADSVVAFPQGFGAWASYLMPEIETAKSQGFDVMGKGLTITVKKNGKILRRATGQPQWTSLIGTMEVLDGSKFGMPGDSGKYGEGTKYGVIRR